MLNKIIPANLTIKSKYSNIQIQSFKLTKLDCDKISFTKTQEKCAFCNSIMLTEAEIDEKIQDILPLKSNSIEKELNKLSKMLYPQSKSLLWKDKYNSVLKRRICIINKIKLLSSVNQDKSLLELVNILKQDSKLSPHALKSKSEKEILKYIYLPLLKSTDHLTPKIRGGKNSQNNYKTVCQGCNWHKSDKTYEEFAKQYPEIIHIKKSLI